MLALNNIIVTSTNGFKHKYQSLNYQLKFIDFILTEAFGDKFIKVAYFNQFPLARFVILLRQTNAFCINNFLHSIVDDL